MEWKDASSMTAHTTIVYGPLDRQYGAPHSTLFISVTWKAAEKAFTVGQIASTSIH